MIKKRFFAFAILFVLLIIGDFSLSNSFGLMKLLFNKNLFKILDRREAIQKALSLAQANDLVLITGMGEGHGIFPNSTGSL